jgi:hypothetical protein
MHPTSTVALAAVRGIVREALAVLRQELLLASTVRQDTAGQDRAAEEEHLMRLRQVRVATVALLAVVEAAAELLPMVAWQETAATVLEERSS